MISPGAPVVFRLAWNDEGVSDYLTNPLILLGSPNGTRTRVSGVRGRHPRPLDDGTNNVAGGLGFEPR